MRTQRRGRQLEDMTPEARAKVEAAKTRARTPEARAEERAVREAFADRPSVRQLIDRGELDPDSATSGNVRASLRGAVAALKRAREADGLSLTEVADRCGIDRAALSRLENEHNINPKLETLGRYAGALGLELSIRVGKPAAAEVE